MKPTTKAFFLGALTVAVGPKIVKCGAKLVNKYFGDTKPVKMVKRYYHKAEEAASQFIDAEIDELPDEVILDIEEENK